MPVEALECATASSDRGGGLAYVDDRMRLVEGMALPSEEIEFRLSYYNSNTFWIDLEDLLGQLGI